MSEKRFFTKINKNGRLIIIDKECHIEIIDLTLACEVLNRLDLKLKTYNEQLGEQHKIIEQSKRYEDGLWVRFTRLEKENEQLAEENKKLRKELSDCEKFRYEVFKRIGELSDE